MNCKNHSLWTCSCKVKAMGQTLNGSSKDTEEKFESDSCSSSQGIDSLKKCKKKRKYDDTACSNKKQKNQREIYNNYLDLHHQAAHVADGNKLCLPTPKTSFTHVFNKYQNHRYDQKLQLDNSKILVHFPFHQDVKLRKLPFFDVIEELLKPSTLVPIGSQKNVFEFQFTSQQAKKIASSRDLANMSRPIQVIMRICLLNKSSEQDDFFPPGLFVEVNEEIFELPSLIVSNNPREESKQQSQPLNITPLMKLCPNAVNHISISWNTRSGDDYVVTVQLVHKVDFEELLQKLNYKEIRHSKITIHRIEEKFSTDSDQGIATTFFRMSLVCPLGMMRMLTPCQSFKCQHIQCFDASMFLRMNEKKPTWKCPICDARAFYEDLVIDGYFLEILNSESLPLGVKEIQIHPDGSWLPVATKKMSPEMGIQTESESDSDDTDGSDGS